MQNCIGAITKTKWIEQKSTARREESRFIADDPKEVSSSSDSAAAAVGSLGDCFKTNVEQFTSRAAPNTQISQLVHLASEMSEAKNM